MKEHEAEVGWEIFPVYGVYIAQFALMVKELNKDISWLYLVHEHQTNKYIQELIPNRVYVVQVLAFNGSLSDGPSYSTNMINITTPPGGELQGKLMNKKLNAVNKASISLFFYTLSLSRHRLERRTISAPLANSKMPVAHISP